MTYKREDTVEWEHAQWLRKFAMDKFTTLTEEEVGQFTRIATYLEELLE